MRICSLVCNELSLDSPVIGLLLPDERLLVISESGRGNGTGELSGLPRARGLHEPVQRQDSLYGLLLLLLHVAPLNGLPLIHPGQSLGGQSQLTVSTTGLQLSGSSLGGQCGHRIGRTGATEATVVGQQTLLLVFLFLTRHHHIMLFALFNRLLGAFLVLDVLAFGGSHRFAVGRVLHFAGHLGRHLGLFGLDQVRVRDLFAVLAGDLGHFEVHLTGNQFAFAPSHRFAGLVSGPYLRTKKIQLFYSQIVGLELLNAQE